MTFTSQQSRFDRSNGTKFALFALGNILLLASLFVFTPGFLSSELFPREPFSPSDDSNHVQIPETNPPFDRVVFLLIDALRPDFVYGTHSGFEFTQSLINNGSAIPFTAHVAPPTVTLPRLKALTTGSIPGFADVMGNLDQSDASSFQSQDSWLGRWYGRGGRLVFYGDDTWLRLFGSSATNGSLFARSEGVDSLLTSEYTEVDSNVTRHVSGEMEQSDWNALILHYLGVDHIGHMSGPRASYMIKKQKQMDNVVKTIFEAIENHAHHKNTLLVLLGDHGMNEAGNHGGSDPGETEATLLFASPKFRTMSARKEYECPTLPTEGTLYNFYDQVEQQDLVPMLSGLMGLPIPRNSIGKVSSELRGVFQDDEAYVSLLEQNAHQLWDLIDAVLGHEDLHSDEETRHNRSLIDDAAQLSCRASINTVNKLTCQLRFAEQLTERSKQTKRWDDSRAAYEEFLAHAQHALIDGNRSFSVFHMAAGIATCALALLICLYSIGSSWPSGMTIAIFTSIAACYGITLLGSTSERSEQSFWYLSSSVWIVFLTARAMSRCKSELARPRIVKACVKNLVLHCIAVCWTRLGPMIDRVVFSQHITLKWSTMLVVYSWNSIDIFRHTFGGIVTRSTAVSWTTPLVTAALIFKVSCEQEHAHKIALPFVSDRTFLFRTLLVLTALAALGVCILVARRNSSADTRLAAQHSTLSERLHRLLTLFLITQSRAENMPLFLVLEHQRIALQTLFQHETLAHPGPAPIDAAISVLTLSHNFFFSSGGSNSISSIDLSNAYNGITDYNVSTVGVLLFAANWTGPIWWCSAACDLVPRDRPLSEQHISSNGRHQSADGTEMRSDTNDKHGEPTNDRPSTPWLTYLSTLSTLMALVVLIVMVLCTMRREDSAVWRLWGPKYLYSVFWVLEWHLAVSLGLSSILRALGGVGLKHM